MEPASPGARLTTMSASHPARTGCILQWSLYSLYQATHSIVAHGHLPGVLLKPFHG